MNLKYLGYLLGILFIGVVGGCKKLVDVNPPVTSLVTTNVFNSDNTAIAAQLSLYAQLQNVPWTMASYTALSSDEFYNYSTGQYAIDLYQNNLSASTDGNSLPWPLLYNLIYQENAILENVQGSNEISSNTRKLITGEAEFLRAYLYFYLVNFYGDVPLITTTDYKVNTAMKRTPQAAVYQQIIKDLRDAQNSLSSNYMDATDTVTTVNRVRPTTWAASALLSRVYLYTQNYDSAEMEASSVINNTSMYGLPGLDSVFLANSKEAIWQIQPPSSWLYTYEGNNFILTSNPGGNGINNSCTISPQLLNAFEAGDERRIKWIGVFPNGADTFYFPFKYKDNSLTATVLKEYSMVLRVGELFLIRAEARAQQNKLTDAINDINSIRTRAGLPGLLPILSQAQILSAISHERQVELFTEDDRWFDLKRTNMINTVMGVVTSEKGGSWNSYDQLYPLPETEIQNGYNLSQNAGY